MGVCRLFGRHKFARRKILFANKHQKDPILLEKVKTTLNVKTSLKLYFFEKKYLQK